MNKVLSLAMQITKGKTHKIDNNWDKDKNIDEHKHEQR